MRLPRPAWIILGLLGILVLAAIFGPVISPYGVGEVSGNRLAPPDGHHWFGTDLHGRDLLTRLMYGARISLLVGLVGASISLLIGVAYGLVAGYLGGRVDNLMMRVVDVLYALPRIVLVIVLISLFDLRLKTLLDGTPLAPFATHARLLLLFVGLGLVEWLTLARIVRAQVLTIKERPFVLSSRLIGQTTPVILFRQILPQVLPIVTTYLTLALPAVILEESFLSFLGLGVQAPLASWGTLLADGASMLNPVATPWWLIVFPAVILVGCLLLLNLLGDQLRRLDAHSER
ncbi:MAG: ABC transporter permease [Verrucomicrobia bacterium]|nr:ABC transporter permease [Verrucomicrobiota bacterium]NBU68481.1 ABC transporter permease [Verrucomicrobiota bacterium]NDC00335.1 ABC transporter permease [Verrucomicrobiota bacterium]NDF16634.1 ABC transporter permease [Verrucomicrobiota bacterium]